MNWNKINAVALAVTFVLFAGLSAFAADQKNERTSVYESEDAVIVKFTYDFGDDSTDVLYSKAVYILDCSGNPAYIKSWMDALVADTVDINVQYSFDLESWTLGANNSGEIVSDQLGAVQRDTLNIHEGSEDLERLTNGVFVRFYAENGGADTNPSGVKGYLQAAFKKDVATKPKRTSDRIFNSTD